MNYACSFLNHPTSSPCLTGSIGVLRPLATSDDVSEYQGRGVAMAHHKRHVMASISSPSRSTLLAAAITRAILSSGAVWGMPACLPSALGAIDPPISQQQQP